MGPTQIYLFLNILQGDTGVGKSNLLTRYSKNEFNLESKATVGADFMTRTIDFENSKIMINLWDTAGEERFSPIFSMLYKGAVGCLIVYDITKYFFYIPNWSIQGIRLLKEQRYGLMKFYKMQTKILWLCLLEIKQI